MTTLLEYYQQHGISPVTQDVSDLEAHFQRRAFLYRSLGLPPVAIEGKHVLEVGPGSGQNALYTMLLNPAHYLAFEPNPTGAAELRKLLPGVEIIGEPIDRYLPHMIPNEADVVLCEGLLGLYGSDPKVLLEHVVRHVKVGGVLVITTIDPISDCAEVIRRAMAHRIVDRTKPLQEQVDSLKPYFASHLAMLHGMTRSVEDWILDNLLNPASIGPTFSMADAFTALQERFVYLGSSPRFQDWRWYKSAPSSESTYWPTAYWRSAHGLLDHRLWPDPRPEWLNRNLMRTCERIRAEVATFEAGPADGSTAGLVDALLDLTDIPRTTMLSVQDAIRVLKAAPTTATREFSSWFGRGQQYLSVVRVH